MCGCSGRNPRLLTILRRYDPHAVAAAPRGPRTYDRGIRIEEPRRDDKRIILQPAAVIGERFASPVEQLRGILRIDEWSEPSLRHRLRQRLVGGQLIGLEVRRRQREPGAHLVEAVGCRVVGKEFRQRHVDLQQVLDGVFILLPRQSPHRPAALGRLPFEAGPLQPFAEPREEYRLLLGGWLRLGGGRHFAAGDPVEHALERGEAAVLDGIDLHVFEVEPGLVAIAVAAARAVPLHERIGGGGMVLATHAAKRRHDDQRGCDRVPGEHGHGASKS
jgi:hypothetical protein